MLTKFMNSTINMLESKSEKFTNGIVIRCEVS